MEVRGASASLSMSGLSISGSSSSSRAQPKQLRPNKTTARTPMTQLQQPSSHSVRSEVKIAESKGMVAESKSTSMPPLPKASAKKTGPETNVRKPTGIKRATQWSPEVEEQYRLQCAGWKNIDEYVIAYDEPERWASNDFLKCLRIKKNGYFSYWREWRECEDKYLNRVKIFTYGDRGAK
ncbi:hypothetical protein TrST_g14118 [Triparma strigata]|uniref:Uncharacterized protein n=1 Tax=Triparma strigata TaxID=1606541 RepID=A0A9W7E905_9STRA|nr:hypothetical protein TrST_g14118 [Triparma strigata]